MFDTIHCNDCDGKPEMMMTRLGDTHMYVFRCPVCQASVLFDECENY